MESMESTFSLNSALDLCTQGIAMFHPSEPDRYVYTNDFQNRRRLNMKIIGHRPYLVSMDYYRSDKFKHGWEIWIM